MIHGEGARSCAFPHKYSDWRVENELLYRYRRDILLDPVTDGVEGWRLVVPVSKRERVLHDAHSLTSAGHLGLIKPMEE